MLTKIIDGWWIDLESIVSYCWDIEPHNGHYGEIMYSGGIRSHVETAVAATALDLALDRYTHRTTSLRMSGVSI